MAYNSAYTGPQVDEAVGAVRKKESTWDSKQDALSGTEDQLVGFNQAGRAIPVVKPTYTASEVGAIPTTEKGVASGVATLGTDGKLTAAQKPAYTASEVGARPSTWTPSASDVGAMPAVSGGSTGQVLTKTNSGQAWQDAPEGGITQEEADARYLQLSGGTLTGPLVLSGNPTVDAQAANKAYVDSKSPKAIPISIPTTGWTDNKQTFTVTGIPSDPTTYEVHLSQVGATNVAAAMACGLYIADEAQNSLTLAVSSVPEAAFQVYAVVQGVSV